MNHKLMQGLDSSILRYQMSLIECLDSATYSALEYQDLQQNRLRCTSDLVALRAIHIYHEKD